jgi:hypothetical protein
MDQLKHALSSGQQYSQLATSTHEKTDPRLSALEISADHTGMTVMKKPTPNPAITRAQHIQAAFLADA